MKPAHAEIVHQALREDKISAGQYVRFPVGKELSKCLTDAGN